MEIKNFETKEKSTKKYDSPGRPSHRPPLEVLRYLSDDLDLQTAEIAKIMKVRPATVRVWRHLVRKGEYK